jgi:hypothetical protein
MSRARPFTRSDTNSRGAGGFVESAAGGTGNTRHGRRCDILRAATCISLGGSALTTAMNPLWSANGCLLHKLYLDGVKEDTNVAEMCFLRVIEIDNGGIVTPVGDDLHG